jgi:hypothetical protein
MLMAVRVLLPSVAVFIELPATLAAPWYPTCAADKVRSEREEIRFPSHREYHEPPQSLLRRPEEHVTKAFGSPGVTGRTREPIDRT